VAVETEDGDMYFINKDGKKYRILSHRLLRSWNFPIIIQTSAVALSKYPVAVSKFPFRDGTLLNNVADGKLYLVSEGLLKHIVSPDVLTRLGVSEADALVVSQAEINIMKHGGELQ
jgi:hypothetical protein